MKVTITIEKEVEAKTLHVSAGARHWEDSTVNGVEDTEGTLIPFRNGDRWEPVIDIDAGKILDWPKGTTAEIHYKVCDDGLYEVRDVDGNSIHKVNCYVPDILSPEGDGWGDYIIMAIDKNGFIDHWQKSDLESLLDNKGF